MAQFIYLLLSLLLLVPSFNAAPATSAEESVDASMKGFLERLKLFGIALEEVADLFNEIISQGPKVLRAVLNDPKVQEVQSDTMSKYTKEIREWIHKYEEFESATPENKPQVSDLMEEYDNLLSKFNSDNNDELSEEAKVIRKSLEQNGWKDMETSVENHFKNFLQKFITEVDKYVAGLNEKERKGEAEFIESVDKLKAETDVEKQMELFEKFFGDDDD